MDHYSNVRDNLEQSLYSFEPSTFTSVEFGYSVAHPPGWEPVAGENKDYKAWNPATHQQVSVQIALAEGHTNVATYGETASITYGGEDATITSRQLVYTSRPNPGYRMEYTAFDTSAGRQWQSTALITLSGDNAIWVFVGGWAEDWASTKALADEIFLRFAVRG